MAQFSKNMSKIETPPWLHMTVYKLWSKTLVTRVWSKRDIYFILDFVVLTRWVGNFDTITISKKIFKNKTWNFSWKLLSYTASFLCSFILLIQLLTPPTLINSTGWGLISLIGDRGLINALTIDWTIKTFDLKFPIVLF